MLLLLPPVSCEAGLGVTSGEDALSCCKAASWALCLWPLQQ